jgi:hypothetical protein
MPVKKILRATVERLEKSTAVLDVEGHEVAFPRASLPTPLLEGEVLVFSIDVDAASAARDEVAENIDSETSKAGAGRKRGNPRTASTRSNKK